MTETYRAASGEQLKVLREANGWTLEQAAALLDLEPHVLSGVERGWRTLTARQWIKVRHAVEAAIRAAQRNAAAAATQAGASESKPDTTPTDGVARLPGSSGLRQVATKESA